MNRTSFHNRLKFQTGLRSFRFSCNCSHRNLFCCFKAIKCCLGSNYETVLLLPSSQFNTLAANVVVNDHKKLNVRISRSTWFWEMVYSSFCRAQAKVSKSKQKTAQETNWPTLSNRAKLSRWVQQSNNEVWQKT